METAKAEYRQEWKDRAGKNGCEDDERRKGREMRLLEKRNRQMKDKYDREVNHRA